MTDTFDLPVCGAGCAGFCAAVTAARLGARVALPERYHTPGVKVNPVTAAALAVLARVLPGQLDPETVRQTLDRAGAIVPGLSPTRSFRDQMAPL